MNCPLRANRSTSRSTLIPRGSSRRSGSRRGRKLSESPGTRATSRTISRGPASTVWSVSQVSVAPGPAIWMKTARTLLHSRRSRSPIHSRSRWSHAAAFRSPAGSCHSGWCGAKQSWRPDERGDRVSHQGPIRGSARPAHGPTGGTARPHRWRPGYVPCSPAIGRVPCPAG